MHATYTQHGIHLLFILITFHCSITLPCAVTQVNTSFIHVLMFKQTTKLAKANLKFVENTPPPSTCDRNLHIQPLAGLIKDILVALS